MQSYLEGGPPLVFGETTGGQGVPDVEFDEPDAPGVVEPELDDPVLGVDPPGVPGKVPQGEPVGLDPGEVLGCMVEGAVLLPGVGFGEVDPGTVGGVAGLTGGVAGLTAPVGGLTGVDVLLPCCDEVPAGAVRGVVVAVPGELEELPFGVVPEGELCATAQPEPHTIANVSVASLAGIQVTPVLNLSLLCAESNRSVRHKR